MPTYEYRCPEGHEFEKFYRKISDAVADLPCPECGKIATRQISAGAGLLFKGSGFYLTDYGKNAHRKAAPAPEGEKSGGSGSSEKAETSPAGAAAPPKAGAAESKPVAEKPAPAKPGSGKPVSGGGKSEG